LVTSTLAYQNLSGLEDREPSDVSRNAHEIAEELSGRAHEIYGSAELLDEVLRGPVVGALRFRDDVPQRHKKAVARMIAIGPALREAARAVARDIEHVAGAHDETQRQAAVEQLGTDLVAFREKRDQMHTAVAVLSVRTAILGFSLRHPVTTALNHQYLDWLEMATRGDIDATPAERWLELAKRSRAVLGNVETLEVMLSGTLVGSLALREDVPGQRNAIKRMSKLVPVLSERARGVAEAIEQIASAPNKTQRLHAVRRLAANLKAFQRTRGEMWTYAAVFEPAAMNGLARLDPTTAKALRAGTYNGGFEAERVSASKRRKRVPSRVKAPAGVTVRPAPAVQLAI
jgi:hypothetical protein